MIFHVALLFSDSRWLTAKFSRTKDLQTTVNFFAPWCTRLNVSADKHEAVVLLIHTHLSRTAGTREETAEPRAGNASKGKHRTARRKGENCGLGGKFLSPRPIFMSMR